jgi:branched-chain amino acid transport system substrate-binding protein
MFIRRISKQPALRALLFMPLLWSGVACNSLIGLDDLAVRSAGDGGTAASVVQCTTNRECVERAFDAEDDDGGSDAAASSVPSVCVKPEGRCVPLLSEDCTTVTGDYLNEDAIVIGSLFSITGAQAETNVHRQQSAMLAVEEINAAGGVPAGPTSARGRPLVLVSCDEVTNLLRAGTHLTRELKVPAIVGPNTSQDTLDLSNMLSIAAGTIVLSPTAVASSISDLLDNQLTWLMVPSDVQRAPLMIAQLGELERTLATARGKTSLRLGVIFRNDALGSGTRIALNTLVWNGKPLVDAIGAGDVRIDPYDFKQTDQSALVDAYTAFAPDVIVLAGTAEAVTNIMMPLEARWETGEGGAGARPYYMLIDSSKTPDLLTAVTGKDELRQRIRGTGITSTAESAPVYDAFKLDYELRFPGSPSSISGMGPAYDAAYAIAYALAATHGQPIDGATIAGGLRTLSGGASVLPIGPTKILAAFQKLVAGESITAVGTFGPLQWDQNGAVLGGTIQMWCVGLVNGMPAFQSSGLTFDIATQQLAGTYTPCTP